MWSYKRLSTSRQSLQRLMETVAAELESQHSVYKAEVKPYSMIPGPRPLPFFGNTWRFVPYIGIFNLFSIIFLLK